MLRILCQDAAAVTLYSFCLSVTCLQVLPYIIHELASTFPLRDGFDYERFYFIFLFSFFKYQE